MALDLDQRMKLDQIIEGSREFPKALTDWETGFVSSFEERLEQYGDSTLISDKQWAILDRIYSNIMAELS